MDNFLSTDSPKLEKQEAVVQNAHTSDAMPDARALRARDGVRFLAAILLPLIPPLALLAGIRTFAVNVPYWDEWDLVPFIIGLRDRTLTFADFWMQLNEHRIVTVKLIMAPLILLNRFRRHCAYVCRLRPSSFGLHLTMGGARSHVAGRASTTDHPACYHIRTSDVFPSPE